MGETARLVFLWTNLRKLGRPELRTKLTPLEARTKRVCVFWEGTLSLVQRGGYPNLGAKGAQQISFFKHALEGHPFKLGQETLVFGFLPPVSAHPRHLSPFAVRAVGHRAL